MDNYEAMVKNGRFILVMDCTAFTSQNEEGIWHSGSSGAGLCVGFSMAEENSC